MITSTTDKIKAAPEIHQTDFKHANGEGIIKFTLLRYNSDIIGNYVLQFDELSKQIQKKSFAELIVDVTFRMNGQEMSVITGMHVANCCSSDGFVRLPFPQILCDIMTSYDIEVRLNIHEFPDLENATLSLATCGIFVNEEFRDIIKQSKFPVFESASYIHEMKSHIVESASHVKNIYEMKSHIVL